MSPGDDRTEGTGAQACDCSGAGHDPTTCARTANLCRALLGRGICGEPLPCAEHGLGLREADEVAARIRATIATAALADELEHWEAPSASASAKPCTLAEEDCRALRNGELRAEPRGRHCPHHAGD